MHQTARCHRHVCVGGVVEEGCCKRLDGTGHHGAVQLGADRFVVKDGAVLASNTSTLDIDEIAGATKRPADVLGTHFFSPANVMKLLEIVRGKDTAKEVVATCIALARTLAKVGAVCGNCDGFLANRSRAPFQTEMNILVEEGAKPQQIDKVMYEFGYPMGPFAVGDLAGLDIGYAVRQRRKKESPNEYRALPTPENAPAHPGTVRERV